ncbi:MAG TPA: hypothetical protein VHC22_02755 [Pirellulales bacterium]|nr:hypothetical protein [Pirellulales bacterium]
MHAETPVSPPQPPGWEGVAQSLEELRASLTATGGFLDQQWSELESLRCELDDQARVLDYRSRELNRMEEELARNLELAELYKQLAQARCDLLTTPNGVPGDAEEALIAAWARIEELEREVVSLSGLGAVTSGQSGTR